MLYDEQDKEYLIQFLPERYLYLTKKTKIRFNGINLKTDLIINLIHEFMLNYYSRKQDFIERQIKMNVWSIILKKKYGAFYNYYIDYLVDVGFIILESNYFASKKSRTYKINIDCVLFPKRVRITDKVLLKKYSKEYLENTFLSNLGSPIPYDIRKKLIDDLYSVDVNYDEAISYLDGLNDNRDISHTKYYMNKIMVDSLSIKHIFFKFDEFGRMHTNFTTLKKEVRKKFIKYKGGDMCEEDISNSQPLFLAVLMKNTMNTKDLFSPELNRYFDLVKNGLLYEEFMDKFGITDRDVVKDLMYRVLFGTNKTIKYNKMFEKLFPTVFNFIKEYKEQKNDYRTLSHALQSLESKFIFDVVVRHIMNKNPNIPIITIHDSLFYPEKYKNEVKEIFEYHLRKLMEDTEKF